MAEIISMVGIISVAVQSYLGKIEATLLAGYDKLQGVKNYSIFLLYFS